MRVVRVLAFGLIVLVAYIGNGNAVTAAATPNPDPCRIFFGGRPYPRMITTTTEPPKTEKQIALEARKEKVKQFETLLEEFLLWGPAPVPTPAPAPPPPPPPPAIELQPETPKSQPGFNAMFDNDFLTKMVQFILY